MLREIEDLGDERDAGSQGNRANGVQRHGEPVKARRTRRPRDMEQGHHRQHD